MIKNFKKSSKFWVVNFRNLSWSENQQIDPFKAKSTVARIFVPTFAVETAFSGYFQSKITKNWDGQKWAVRKIPGLWYSRKLTVLDGIRFFED